MVQGAKGVGPAETVAERVVDEARKYLDTPGVPVGEHLADQILIPLALILGGSQIVRGVLQHGAG